MNVAQLRCVLEHLPDELPVHIAGHGECVSARRPVAPWITAALYLDTRGPLLHGTYRDKRTLNVRLEALGATA